jgi:hypothetical protein
MTLVFISSFAVAIYRTPGFEKPVARSERQFPIVGNRVDFHESFAPLVLFACTAALGAGDFDKMELHFGTGQR